MPSALEFAIFIILERAKNNNISDERARTVQYYSRTFMW